MFESPEQIRSFILATIVLVVYEAIVLMCYWLFAPVVMGVIYAIFNSEVTVASGGAYFQAEFVFVTKVFFALCMVLPIFWFVLWVYRVESGNQPFIIQR